MSSKDRQDPARVVAKVSSLWRRFFEEVQRTISDLDAQVDLPLGPPALKDGDGLEADTVRISTAHPLILDNLPERTSATRGLASKRVHVELEGDLIFDLNSPTHLVGYRTSVMWAYDKRSRKEAMEFADAYIFDMDLRGFVGHPVFHAQRDCTFASVRFRQEGQLVDQKIEPAARIGIKTIRIPTAQMDLFSTCVMLIADHLVDHSDRTARGHFRAFNERIADIWRHAPDRTPRFDPPREASDFRSSHWYPVAEPRNDEHDAGDAKGRPPPRRT